VLCVLVAIVLIGMGLRLYGLHADSLWLDEILTAEKAQLDLPSLLSLVASGDRGKTQLPLTFAVTHAFTALSGDSEFVIRFQAALFGTLSILLVYGLGRTLWTEEVGLCAALMLAVNAYHVNYSQEARYYSLMVFLALLTILFLVRALEGKSTASWLGFLLSATLSLYNHYFAALLLAALAIYGTVIVVGDWISWQRERNQGAPLDTRSQWSPPARQAVALFTSLALIGVSFLPWVTALRAVVSRQLGGNLLSLSFAKFQRSLDFLHTVLVDYVGPGSAPAALLLLWVALLLLGVATTDRRRILLLVLCTAAPFVFAAVVTPNHPFRSKYAIFILPALLLVTAQGVVALTRRLQRVMHVSESKRGLRLAVSLALTAALFVPHGLSRVGQYYAKDQTDWRGAALYLQANAALNDIILADGDGYRLPDSLRVTRCLPYYLDQYGVDTAAILPVKRGLQQKIEGHTQDQPGETWAVIYHLRRGLGEEDLHGVTVTDFRHVAVIRLLDPSGDVLQDTVSMLTALPGILPSEEAHFDVTLALAAIHLDRGKLSAAASQLEQASLVLPNDSRARRDLARAYCGLGRAYERRGSLGKATTAYEVAFSLDPDSPRASRLYNETHSLTQ
jgi:tetratricopeptide (TPR) repeat protein